MRTLLSSLLLAAASSTTTTMTKPEPEPNPAEPHKRGGSALVPEQIRDILGHQALDLLHDHGVGGVDLSLEGYDHDLASRDLAEGAFKPRRFDEEGDYSIPQWDNAPAMGRMHERSAPIDDRLVRREVLVQQALEARETLGEGVDYSLEGYDHSLLGEDEDEDQDDGEEIDYSLEGYDHALVARSLRHTKFSAQVPSSEPSQPSIIKGPPVQQPARRPTESGLQRSGIESVWAKVRRWAERRGLVD